jgi:acetyl esterase
VDLGGVSRTSGAAKRWCAAPLLADLAGLPPAQLIIGRLDLLLDDSQRFAARLKEAAVPCELTIYDGINHGFIRYGRLIATARRAIADCAAALGRALEAR